MRNEGWFAGSPPKGASRRRAVAGFDLEIDIGQRFALVILHDGVLRDHRPRQREVAYRHKRENNAIAKLGKPMRLGGTMTVNTSLVRECLELILMLADALDRKQAKLTASQDSLPVMLETAPVELLRSEKLG
jgi:hypothetical protein